MQQSIPVATINEGVTIKSIDLGFMSATIELGFEQFFGPTPVHSSAWLDRASNEYTPPESRVTTSGNARDAAEGQREVFNEISSTLGGVLADAPKTGPGCYPDLAIDYHCGESDCPVCNDDEPEIACGTEGCADCDPENCTDIFSPAAVLESAQLAIDDLEGAIEDIEVALAETDDSIAKTIALEHLELVFASMSQIQVHLARLQRARPFD